jgi:hypothetical protein
VESLKSWFVELVSPTRAHGNRDAKSSERSAALALTQSPLQKPRRFFMMTKTFALMDGYVSRHALGALNG